MKQFSIECRRNKIKEIKMTILTSIQHVVLSPCLIFFQRIYINVRNTEEQKMEGYHEEDISL